MANPSVSEVDASVPAVLRIEDDDFTLFGLPRRFALERAEVDRRWRELQARVHPDRFSAEGAVAQRMAMQWAVRVNEAHRRLRDPVQRASLLCELGGHPVNAEVNTSMPPAFLVQQMGWREGLEEAEGAAELEAMLADVNAAREAQLAQLEQALDRDPDVAKASALVRQLMFIERFHTDVEARIDAL